MQPGEALMGTFVKLCGGVSKESSARCHIIRAPSLWHISYKLGRSLSLEPGRRERTTKGLGGSS